MTITTILPPARTTFLDTNSNPLAGGQVFFYVPPNTTTLKTTYQDATATIPNTNPVILDGDGSALIYGTGQYLMELWDVDNNLIYTGLTQDVYGLITGSNNTWTGSNDFTGGSIIVTTEPPGTNNTTAASTAFVAAAIASISSPLYGGAIITGILPTGITGNSTTASLTSTVGTCVDSTNATIITAPSINWAVSNGNAINGYQGGSTLPNSSSIHFFVCKGASGVGLFAHTSLSPSIPAGFNTNFRRVFSLRTDSSGNLLQGQSVETEGGAFVLYLTVPILDFSGTVSTTSSLQTISVPLALNFSPIARYWTSGSNTSSIMITSPLETDLAATNEATAGGYGYDIGGNAAFSGATGSAYVVTNTSAQLRFRASNAMNLQFVTRGWKDFRRN